MPPELGKAASWNGDSMLKVRGVETGYGRLKILRGIDMDVPEGGAVALLGGNGTGKSTLLKAISGLLRVWAGEIEFDGKPIQNRKPNDIVKAGLVQVTQGKDSYPGLTVEENLKLGAHTRNDRAKIKSDLEQIYEFFPILRERRKQLAGLLSGGQIQMLVIGRGMMAAPKMIMLDEPSAALAPLVVLDIFRQINKIRAELGTTILVVEQNVRMALLLAEYGYVIHDENVRNAYLGGTVVETANA